MQVGVVFPQIEIGSDPGAVRAYADAVSALGYHHLLAYDHVVGADPEVHRGWNGPLRHPHTFHEPMVLFGYLAGISDLELVTGIVIAPQRQTALLAKQAAEVDVLTGGRLRLGVGLGWNRPRVRGARQGLLRPLQAGRRAGHAAQKALDRRERHLRGPLRAAARGRAVADAGPAPHPGLVRGQRPGGLATDRSPGRRLVPPGAARDGPGEGDRDRRRRRPRRPAGRPSPSKAGRVSVPTAANGSGATSRSGVNSVPGTCRSTPCARATSRSTSTSPPWPRPRRWP